MKHLNKFLLAFMILTSLHAWGQVSEGSRSMSLGDNNALSIQINGLDRGTVEKLWKKYAHDFDGKEKYNRKSDELTIDNASLPNLSSNTVDVYSKAEKMGDGTSFSVWFDLGGAFLNSKDHPDKYANAVILLNNFQKETDKYKVNELLKAEEKKLDNLKDDHKDLVKDKDGYEKDIKKAEKAIEDAKAKIEKNIKDQQAKQAEIDNQHQVVEKVKSDLNKI